MIHVSWLFLFNQLSAKATFDMLGVELDDKEQVRVLLLSSLCAIAYSHGSTRHVRGLTVS